MPIPKVCPLIEALRKNPNLITLKEEKPVYKTLQEVMKTKTIGAEAAKTDAWWRYEYREAKAIEEAIRNGTYEPAKPLYPENGGLNMDVFHPKWDPYGEDGLI